MLSDKFHHSSSTIFDASSLLLFRSFLAPSRIMVRSFVVIFCAFSSVFARRRCISTRKSSPEEGSTSEGAWNSDSILEDLLLNPEEESTSEGAWNSDSMLEDLLLNAEEGSTSEGARNSDSMLEDLLLNPEEGTASEGVCNSDFMLEEDILTEGIGNVEVLVAIIGNNLRFWTASSSGEVFVIVLGRIGESVLPAGASCILRLLKVAGRVLLFCVWDI
jgi:hypothetical protein